MHYYNFHIGDYAGHTQHLDEIEDIAYRRMLDWLYLNEMPLPKNVDEIARLIRMRTHCERIATVLREFFKLDKDGYKHERVSRELAKFQEKSEKAKKSAEARWKKKPSDSKGLDDANALRTECERNANQEPITNNQEPITNNQKQTKELREQVRSVFDYWARTFGKSKAVKLSNKRAAKITARLKDGYTVQQLQCAILGCSNSEYHMENGYNDIELICREPEKVDRFIFLNQPKQAPVDSVLDDFINNEQPTFGEVRLIK